MPKFQDLTGQKFNRLTVLRRLPSDKNMKVKWEVKCDCGEIREVTGGSLKSGNTKSCGCLKKEVTVEYNKNNKVIHGLSRNKLYQVHIGMVKRCYDSSRPKYKDWGGRGITVCEEWLDKESGLKSFVEWAENNGYEKGLDLDREDNDGNYEPSNCRFISHRDNCLNRRKRTDNTSGYVGVGYEERSSIWRSQIQVNGKKKNIGRFQTKQEAVEARNNYIIENKLEHEYKIQ